MDEPRYISAEEVKDRLTMKKAIDAMRLAYADLSSGKAIVPERLPLHTANATHYLMMPAHFPSGGITTVKSVSLNPDNPGRGEPFIHAVILVFEDETGKPVAIVDGSEVTAIRTAAASGLATDLFANPQASTAAIFGTGALAKPHVDALLAVRPISTILIFGSSQPKAKKFCQHWQATYDSELVPETNLDRLKEVDVICTATTSASPLFDHAQLKRGVHINAVGVYKADYQEVPMETVVASTVFIDQMEGVMAEAGDLLIPMSRGLIDQSHFSREIGQVILGEIDHTWNEQAYTIFKSVGNAIQDAAAVNVLLND